MQEDAAAITSFQGAGIVLKEWNNIGRFGLRDFACFGQLDVEVARCSRSCRVWRPFLPSFILSSSFLTPLLLRGCVLEGYSHFGLLYRDGGAQGHSKRSVLFLPRRPEADPDC